MKTKEKTKSNKTTIQELIEIRDRINHKTQNMIKEELIEYFSKQKTLRSSEI